MCRGFKSPPRYHLLFVLIMFEISGFYRREKTGKLKQDQYNNKKVNMKKSILIKKAIAGGDHFHVWAGPCAIESEKQFLKTAKFVKRQGAAGLRGGIFKLRTDPKDFQGLGAASLPMVQRVKIQTGLLFISEITDPRQMEVLEPILDVYQVGARNMFNYELLKELGKGKKPVLLKRAFSARITEWLKAADYLVQGGNENIILCERGIRTFETQTRNTLDLNAVAYLKRESSFPVFVDPSHGTGEASLVASMSKAAVAAGADGLLIETHPEPAKALCDSHQALPFKHFERLTRELRRLLPLFGKKF